MNPHSPSSRFGTGGHSDRSDRDRLPAVRGSSEAKYHYTGTTDSPRDHAAAGASSFRRTAMLERPHSQPHHSTSAAHTSDSYALDGDDGLSHNPFTLPKEDVFLLREREKQQKQLERERLNSLKIWEKSSASATAKGGMSSASQVLSYDDKVAARQKYLSTTMNTAQSLAARALHPEGVGPAAMAAAAGGGLGTHSFSATTGSLPPAGGGKERMFQGRRREKENMADLIAKKRDMFLIQMSLDTKRSEIQKLEEKAQMKEDALKKSEMMLEEDAMRFDAFLKENDRKAHDALKRADLETKEKQEKVLEIKKLNAEIAKVENEMSKYEEQLLACMKYKDFLDSLTPPEHWKKCEKRREERVKAKAEKLARRQAATAAQAANGSDEQKENVDGSIPESVGGIDSISDDEEDDEEDMMYFDRPEQLLEIFAQLEERNLFLIQNVQETEEALDELTIKFEETKKTMEEKTNLLHTSIADLKAKIRLENEKCAALKKRSHANTIVGTQQKLLSGLSEKVASVYAKCGRDPDTQTDTLEMLRDIEQSLEKLLLCIASMDPVKVAEAEKRKNNERRNQIRALKKEEQKRQYEERLAKSTARANAEVVKRQGKPVMFRSQPMRKKKVKENVVQRDEEAEELKRFFT